VGAFNIRVSSFGGAANTRGTSNMGEANIGGGANIGATGNIGGANIEGATIDSSTAPVRHKAKSLL
jgi:hypothetical protein